MGEKRYFSNSTLCPYSPWRGLWAFQPHRGVVRTHLLMLMKLVVNENQCVIWWLLFWHAWHFLFSESTKGIRWATFINLMDSAWPVLCTDILPTNHPERMEVSKYNMTLGRWLEGRLWSRFSVTVHLTPCSGDTLRTKCRRCRTIWMLSEMKARIGDMLVRI